MHADGAWFGAGVWLVSCPFSHSRIDSSYLAESGIGFRRNLWDKSWGDPVTETPHLKILAGTALRGRTGGPPGMGGVKDGQVRAFAGVIQYSVLE